MHVFFVFGKGFVISQSENVRYSNITTTYYQEIKLQNIYEFTHTFRPATGVY